jgi:hypothetical protein
MVESWSFPIVSSSEGQSSVTMRTSMFCAFMSATNFSCFLGHLLARAAVARRHLDEEIGARELVQAHRLVAGVLEEPVGHRRPLGEHVVTRVGRRLGLRPAARVGRGRHEAVHHVALGSSPTREAARDLEGHLATGLGVEVCSR